MTAAQQLHLPGAAPAKRCPRCKLTLPLSDFSPKSKKRGDLRPATYCNPCRRALTAKYQGYEPVSREVTCDDLFSSIRASYPAGSTVEIKQVPGFPDYFVGSDGSLWGTRGRSGKRPGAVRRIKPGLDKDGYQKSILYARDKRRRYVRIHRLVLEVFVGPAPDGMDGAHNNGDQLDNRLVNLRWDTHHNNILDKHKHGTWQEGDKASHRKLNSDQVREIKRTLLHEGISAASRLAQRYDVGLTSIYDIAKGKRWRSVTA